MLRTADLDYHLPDRLIATHPAVRREEARLLVISRSDPSFVAHHVVRELPNLLEPHDTLIVNDTRVIPARLAGKRIETGGKVEGLFLECVGESTWRVMLKSNGKLQPNSRIELTPSQKIDGKNDARPVTIRLIQKQDAVWTVECEEVALSPQDTLTRIGQTPLPPYILRARKERGELITDEGHDRDRYQTVYASKDAQAVAAPTAGLHFSKSLLQACRDRQIGEERVTLHVGAGTFKPVEAETLDDHPMHTEWCNVPASTLSFLKNRGQSPNGRTIAVGTTTVRTLESMPALESIAEGESFTTETDLLIAPGFDFRFTDVLMTNFHLPRSTLLALVGAFLGDLERLKDAYATAIEHEYRFYSYGDAMLILP